MLKLKYLVYRMKGIEELWGWISYEKVMEFFRNSYSGGVCFLENKVFIYCYI